MKSETEVGRGERKEPGEARRPRLAAGTGLTSVAGSGGSAEGADPARARRSSPPRSLWPREHGAYAQLAAPMLAALVMAGAGPTPVAILFVLAASLAFLAHEPLLVQLGHRGKRVQRDDGPRARRRVIELAGAALVAAAAGLALADPTTRWMALLAAVAAAAPLGLLAVLGAGRPGRTAGYQVLAAVALAGAGAPIATAGGVPWPTALEVWAAWGLGFGGTVYAVHRLLARHRRKAAAPADPWIALAGALVLGGTALLAWTARPLAAIALPLLVVAVALLVRPPSARRMWTVGVVLTVASTIGTILAATLPR